jgi:hypothetical protein
MRLCYGVLNRLSFRESGIRFENILIYPDFSYSIKMEEILFINRTRNEIFVSCAKLVEVQTAEESTSKHA